MPGGQRPFREDATSYTRTGIPCGNPRRYESRGVVRMVQSDARPFRDQRLEAPVEDIETEGERQLKALVKQQLEKDVTVEGQLSRKKQFEVVNVHQPAVAGVSGALSLEAFRDLEQHDARLEELRQYGLNQEEMRLTLEAEGVGLDGKPAKRSRYGVDPLAHTAKLEEIKRKIAKKRQELAKPDHFSGTRYMSRHEMDLERAITHNRDKARLLGMLMTSERPTLESEDPEDPINHLDALMAEVRRKARKSRHPLGNDGLEPEEGSEVATCEPRPAGYRSNTDQPPGKLCPLCRLPIQSENTCEISEKLGKDSEKSTSGSDNSQARHGQTCNTTTDSQTHSILNEQTSNPVVDPEDSSSVCQCELSKRTPSDNTLKDEEKTSTGELSEDSDTKVSGPRVLREEVESVPEDVIVKYRLTPDQIRQLPRFKDYEPGKPSKTLYLKNLSPRVTESDLVALFIRYQRPEGPKIIFKLMTGRMKGQAFVTFQEEAEATQALNLVNGYDFRGKPIIIQYGRSQ